MTVEDALSTMSISAGSSLSQAEKKELIKRNLQEVLGEERMDEIMKTRNESITNLTLTQFNLKLIFNLITLYPIVQEVLPILYSNSLYKMGNYFLDRQ